MGNCELYLTQSGSSRNSVCCFSYQNTGSFLGSRKRPKSARRLVRVMIAFWTSSLNPAYPTKSGFYRLSITGYRFRWNLLLCVFCHGFFSDFLTVPASRPQKVRKQGVGLPACYAKYSPDGDGMYLIIFPYFSLVLAVPVAITSANRTNYFLR